MSELKVSSPIKQMALGSRGLYQCVLVEQKDMTFEEFNEKAEAEGFKVRKGQLPLVRLVLVLDLCSLVVQLSGSAL